MSDENPFDDLSSSSTFIEPVVVIESKKVDDNVKINHLSYLISNMEEARAGRNLEDIPVHSSYLDPYWYAREEVNQEYHRQKK